MQAGHGVAAHAKHGVAPARLVALAVDPLVGEAGAAEKSDAAINHREFAVSAIVVARPTVPAHLVVPLHVAAGLAQFAETIFGHGERAQGVQIQVDAHAGVGALGERGDDLVGDLAAMEDIGFQVDVVLGGANGGQLGSVKILAVGDDFHAGVTAEFGFHQRLQLVAEIFGIERAGGRLRDLVLQSGLEECQKDVGGDRQNAKSGDVADGLPPPYSRRPRASLFRGRCRHDL